MAENLSFTSPSAQLSDYGRTILRALRKKRGRLEFLGLEDHATTNPYGRAVTRRKKNKVARASRAINHG